MKGLSNKVELHYYFTDSSHTMDAAIRNKCEFEILSIIKEVASIIDAEITIETEAYGEGGLKERFVIIAKNKYVQGALALLIAPVLVNYLSNQLNEDSELDELNKQKIRLEIKKLEREENEASKTSINIENAVLVINKSYKIIKHKSNFYNKLNNYQKITEVSALTLDEFNNDTSEEKGVKRNSFNQFILETDDLPSVEDEAAVISIVSPVLKKGKYKWKGIYNKTGETIDFYMKDYEFKGDVVKEKISFKNGSCIDCILEISKKLNEVGEIINSSYSVLTVLKVHDDESSFVTPQGKKHKRVKEALKNQLRMFDQDESEG